MFRLLAEVDARMRRAEDPRKREEAMNGHLFWALIRLLQHDYVGAARTATDAYLEGRRWELGDVVGSRSDGAMWGWLSPTPMVVNTVAAIAESTVLLQVLGDGPPHSKGQWNRVLAVEEPDGTLAWRSVAPWWQENLPLATLRPESARWVSWCISLPAGAPTGVLAWQPGPGVDDYEDIVRPVADWYRLALATGRRWTCEHGWTHHPRRGDRTQPLSCHREHREESCDRCCLLVNPYRRVAA
jgi:hypothetical protein